ncbi:DUF2207 domain-containing protein [Planomicrobium sp. CPCC 101079]|uniref:DUF2207 domain-containing protein n=1 Tax=Planomicrobium sp. CPCC 101079 TaxID=2599618 RepID=UPI0011B367DF|nr:DUF2207 domain-containing protein [Planomicrobium sp. CPCC 101079]TWT01562.1 DUF2207 domain-containing protein [Planomicrobium sp. CPCC 101079]
MKRKIIPYVLAFILVGLIPAQVYAIDFDISEVRIDVQLNTDGTAEVTEQFTYEFDDDFNGITRSLIAKKGTAIDNFSAAENGKPLKVEIEDGVYQIYRAGDDGDTIEIELSYAITDAVEKFEDGAQFYWAFFDESNESEYGDMTITVTPPAPAENTETLGYEEAFGTEHVTDDGAAVFSLGYVPDGENANVRAIFEPDLFPDAAQLAGTVRDDLAKDRVNLENEAAAFAKNQQTAKNVGIPAIAIGGVLLLAGALALWLRASQRKRQVRKTPYEFFVPKESMSIPALLYFTNSVFLSPNAISAAIMELMRKGNIRQLTGDHFELIHRKTDHAHEATLIQLLFDRIGDGQEFTLQQVEEFTKNELNHAEYNDAIAEWNKGVSLEVKEKDYYEKHTDLRGVAGILSAVFIGLAIYTGIYELFPWMAAAIALAMLAFGVAISYSPLTLEGHEIRFNWRNLKAAMQNLPAEQWDRLTLDEKQRAYAYLLGSDPKTAERKAAAFTSVQAAADDSSFVMNPIFLTAIFVSAGSTTTASASGGTAGSGAGVGGGGGGSGAF